MKVKLRDLHSNPFRNLEKYPVRQERVDGMKQSILDTGYWKNILVRNQNGKVEMAYGHHRKAALVELHGEDHSIDVIVDRMDDSMMLRRMANENDRAAELETDVADASVEAAREYLKAHPKELAKYLSGDDPQTKAAPKKSIVKEIGRDPIAAFLGGFWTPDRVRYVIERLLRYEKEEDHKDYLEKEAVQKFGLAKHATSFQRAIHEVKNVPPEKQKAAAERIVKEEDFKRSRMKEIIEEEKTGVKEKPKAKSKKDLLIIDMKVCIVEASRHARSLNSELGNLISFRTRFKEEVTLKFYQVELQEFLSQVNLLNINLKNLLKGDLFEERKMLEVRNDLSDSH